MNFLYEICLDKNETRQTRIGSYVLPSNAWDSLNNRPKPNCLGRRITDSGNSRLFALSLGMGTWLAPPCQATSDLNFWGLRHHPWTLNPIKSREWQPTLFAFNQSFTKPMDMNGTRRAIQNFSLTSDNSTHGHEEAAVAFSSFSFSISTLRCSACCATPCARA